MKKTSSKINKDYLNYILNYLNEDYFFLIILVLIESFQNKELVIGFDKILKGPYWHIYDTMMIVKNVNEKEIFPPIFMDPEEYIFNQIFNPLFSKLEIAKIKAIRFDIVQLGDSIHESIDEAMTQNHSFNKPHPHTPSFYSDLMHSIFETTRDIIYGHETNPPNYEEHLVSFKIKTIQDIRKEIFVLAKYNPKLVQFKITFNSINASEINTLIEFFIEMYSNDKFYNQQSDNQKTKRLSFSKQIDNFHDYINSLTIINNTANIPIESLLNPNFEVIKILKYLEINKVIAIGKWDTNDFWKVIFNQDPKDISSYTLQDQLSPKATFKNNILYLNNQEYNFLNKFNQKTLLKILFSEPKKEWSYDEIQENWPLEYQDELKDKTFYTACTAINNRLPNRDLLIFNLAIFRLNPKYTG